jgi:hypothetical protein
MTVTGQFEGTAGSGEWRRYRCPVCGHRDAVALMAGREAEIQCSHCQTPLTIDFGSAVDERVTARVAGEIKH